MLKSMIEKVDSGPEGLAIQCKVCLRAYKPAQTTNLKNHIEAKHIDHVRFTCSICGGRFSSRASFRTHARNFHKDQPAMFSVTEQYSDYYPDSGVYNSGPGRIALRETSQLS